MNISRKTTAILGIILFLFYCPALPAKEATYGEILATAWNQFNEDKLTEAAKGFLQVQLAPDMTLRQNARMGLGYTRLKQGRKEAAQSIFLLLVEDGYQLPKTLPALMETYPEGAKERGLIARRILDIDPKHEFALIVSAWDHYHKKEYALAEGYFARLSAIIPHDQGTRIGLGYSLLHQKKFDEAIRLVDNFEPQHSDKLMELRKNVYRQGILESLSQNRFSDAKKLFFRMALLDNDSSMTSITNLGVQVLDGYAHGGKRSDAWNLADDMGRNSFIGVRRAAAYFYAKNKAPVTASQVFDDPEACFVNADASRIDASVYFRHRSGDPGLSRLNEIAFPISAGIAFPLGHQLTFSHVYKQLDSSDPSAFRAGSYYWYQNASQSKAALNNQSDFHELWLNYKKEGTYPFKVAIGTSPIGGDVDTTLLFNIDTDINGFEINVHRTSVDESILSYAGLNDPYGDDAWGRVTKSGGKLGYTISPWRSLWISGRIGFDLYRGENVIDNTAGTVDLAFGQTRELGKKWEFSYGIYGSYQHFERNSNFFTFGHGGYYSPDHMISTGPLIRIKSRPCLDYYLDFQASGGWMWEQTANAPFYPEQILISELSPAGRAEYNGIYQGNEDSSPTALIQLEAWKLLGPKFAIGGYAKMNLTSEYNEWQIGLNLKYYFKKQQNFYW